MSSTCPEMVGLMMEGWRGVAPPHSPPHPHLGLAQPVSQVQGRPDLHPALGWGRAAWHTQTGSVQGGSQVSSPGQVRARSPGTTPRQNQDFHGPLAYHPLASNSSHEGGGGEPTRDPLLQLFHFTDEKKPRPRARRDLPRAGLRTHTPESLFASGILRKEQSIWVDPVVKWGCLHF